MSSFFKKILLSLSLLVFLPLAASAHQPRLNTAVDTTVVSPEVSKAYYGTLTGEPHVYRITSDKLFDLYVNVLVPDIASAKKDVSAAIIKDGKVDAPVAVLDGASGEWKRFWEPFGRDSYWMGPEYRAKAEPGSYEIRVWSSNNDSKYSLAVGEIEVFDAKEGWSAVRLIPKIKTSFFEKSPIDFILSPFGIGYVVAMFALAFLVGFLYRLFLKKFAVSKAVGKPQNIGTKDRWTRVVLGVVLFVLAITTSWSPILLFGAGFCFFQAIFSWCALYAVMGRNTCPE